MSKPLVSVVIPTHNRPVLLRETILSVLAQTYSSLEILIVSNGSSDATREMVKNLDDSRLIYIEQVDSGGPSSPRNNGIDQSKGQYIAFCDDDDLWLPTKIEKQVAALESSNIYGLCYTKMIRFDGNKEWSLQNDYGEAQLKSLLYYNTVPISSVMVRKELVASAGNFSESKKVGNSEDYEFLLRWITKTKFYYIDEFLLKYRSGDGRLSSECTKGHVRSNLKYLKGIVDIFYMCAKNKIIKVRSLIIPTCFHAGIVSKIITYQLAKSALKTVFGESK